MSTATKPKAPPVAAVKMVTGLVESLERVQTKLLPAPAVLLNMTAGGLLVSRSVSIAAELGLADLLSGGPRRIEDLASATSVETEPLYRLMRALASVGIFAEGPARQFRLTALAAYLRSDIPGSMRGWARYLGADWHWDVWGQALESVRNGRSAYENVHGMRFFEWFAQHPEASQIFDQAMTSVSEMADPAIVAAYNFAGIGTVADIAGGRGSLLATILAAHPTMRGVLFDQDHVITAVRHAGIVEDAGLGDRCTLVAGDFFQEVPAGADAYVLKWILHDWNDAEATQILRMCRQAMTVGAKVLIVEMVITPDNAPGFGKLLDLAMLTLTGGRERTAAEYRQLGADAGLRLTRIVPTASPFSIVEAEAI